MDKLGGFSAHHNREPAALDNCFSDCLGASPELFMLKVSEWAVPKNGLRSRNFFSVHLNRARANIENFAATPSKINRKNNLFLFEKFFSDRNHARLEKRGPDAESARLQEGIRRNAA